MKRDTIAKKPGWNVGLNVTSSVNWLAVPNTHLRRYESTKTRLALFQPHTSSIGWELFYKCHALNHRAITTTVPRHVLIVALGVHVRVVLTRTPLLYEARRKRVSLGGGGRRRSWPSIDENSASNRKLCALLHRSCIDQILDSQRT